MICMIGTRGHYGNEKYTGKANTFGRAVGRHVLGKEVAETKDSLNK